jgi:putative thioredoxin
MTVALIGGQVAPLFEGLIAPEQLSELIEKVVALAQKQGVGKGVHDGDGSASDGDDEPEITAAYGALAVSDLNRAKAEFEGLLARKPGDKDALQGLANIELLQRITGHDGSEVMARAAAESGDLSIERLAADFEFLAGDIAGAFARLINLIKITGGDERESLRLQVLSLFAVLDSDDPELVKARSALARALF